MSKIPKEIVDKIEQRNGAGKILICPAWTLTMLILPIVIQVMSRAKRIVKSGVTRYAG